MNKYVVSLCFLISFACCACGGARTQQAPAQPSEVPAAGSGTITIALNCSGVGFNLLGSASTCELHVFTPKTSHRRIDPGEVVDNIGIGKVTPIGSGSYRLSGLPPGQTLILNVVLAPKVDLSSGQAVGVKSSYRASLNIPFSVPAAGSAANDISINFKPNPLGGYLADIRNFRRDGTEPQLHAQLNYRAKTVSRDNDGDGSFGNETAMPDPQLLGISSSLLARLDAQNSAVTQARGSFSARVDSVDLASGQLQVSNLRQLGEGAATVPQSLSLHFAEDSGFTRRSVSLEKVSSGAIVASDLGAGAQLSFEAAALTASTGAPPQIWLDKVQDLHLDLPPDSIAAVPDRQSARPGEPVQVTVYVNRTASPLRSVERLRVSFNASDSYLPGSLDPGEPGGGALQADGVWAGISGGFILPEGDKVASGTLSAARNYVDLALAPASEARLQDATGALCNFSLVCHNNALLGVEKTAVDGPATLYVGDAGKSQQWNVCATATKPQVSVSGKPIILSLAAPQLVGTGGWDRPYLAATGTEIQLKLVDPVDGNVTNSSDAIYFVSGRNGMTFPWHGSSFTIPTGYYGALKVIARYKELFCSTESEVNIFVDEPRSLKLEVDEAQSYIFGGGASGWEIEGESSDDYYYIANIKVQQPSHLQALYFNISFDPAIYLPWDCEDTGLFTTAPGTLIMADPSALRYSSNEGVARFGVVLEHPEAGPGLSGEGGTLLRVRFKRKSLLKNNQYEDWINSPGYLPPFNGSASVCIMGEREIRWVYGVVGDFNQDGEVNYIEAGPGQYCDLSALAMHIGATGFGQNSVESLMDQNFYVPWSGVQSDGVIDLKDMVKLVLENHHKVDKWLLFHAPDSSRYPFLGNVVANIPQSAFLGDPTRERIYFEWRPAEPLQEGIYWVTPYLGDYPGTASSYLSYPSL